MRFGIFIPQGWRHDLVGIAPEDQWHTMLSLAQRADRGPWESLWVFDHFHTVPVATEEATHEAWTLMSAFAASTERIRLGQMCTCMSYRNPAYLAKVAATIDHVSAGRVEMGIGGGWYEHEWRAYGYGFPRVGERLQRLDEGVEIMRQAWSEGVATLDGRHYQVEGAVVRPLPIQQGGPPVWVCGGGEKVTLKIAAKHAAYTNFTAQPEAFAHKSEVLRGHMDAIGRDFGEITRSSNFHIIIAETEKEVADRVDQVEARMVPALGAEKAAEFVAQYRSGELAGVGTVEQVTERMARVKDLGCDYAITFFPEAAYDTSGIELFEREVLPQLR